VIISNCPSNRARSASAGCARVAGGEMIRTFDELVTMVEEDALDVYVPDATGLGARIDEAAVRRWAR
jgi:L-alanine-DL-glutamate epimerase-like enolase superfamily enzyme